MEDNELQPLKALLPRNVSSLGKGCKYNEMQFMKALPFTAVTEFGICTDVIFLQFSNAPQATFFGVPGIVYVPS